MEVEKKERKKKKKKKETGKQKENEYAKSLLGWTTFYFISMHVYFKGYCICIYIRQCYFIVILVSFLLSFILF